MRKFTFVFAYVFLMALPFHMASASIIGDEVSSKPTLAQDIKKAKSMNRSMAKQLAAIHERSFAFHWENPDGYTPKQMLEGYGTDCLALFQQSAAIQDILIKADPTYTPLVPTKTVAFTKDEADQFTGACVVGE